MCPFRYPCITWTEAEHLHMTIVRHIVIYAPLYTVRYTVIKLQLCQLRIATKHCNKTTGVIWISYHFNNILLMRNMKTLTMQCLSYLNRIEAKGLTHYI